MSPATLLAVRPMHPPTFETIPELAPVLEYASGGANTTNNYRSPGPSCSPDSSTSSLHPQNADAGENTSLGRAVVRSSKNRFSLSTAGPAPPQLPQLPQLPPLNTTLPVYPMYPGLQTSRDTAVMTITTTTTTGITPSTMASRRGQEPRPLNRPRKISTAHTRDSSSASTRSSFYETPQQYTAPYQSPTAAAGSPTTSLIPRPRQKLSPAPTPPDELFGTLPIEVLEVVLEWLQALHLEPAPSSGGPRSCATCWTRDLCSLSLASRKWSAAARASLYRDVQLVGPDSAAHRKRFRLAQGCRMTLLRRTLRANSGLAAAVRSLRVPAPTGETCDDTPIKAAGGMSPRRAYESRVAALVMACPNLEVLAGPVATYDHDRFDRITHALSTRTKLKTMNWRIGPATTGAGSNNESSGPDSSLRRGNHGLFASALAAMLPPPPLSAAQEMSFLGCHRAWTSLASLSIHCLPGASLAPDTLLQRVLTCLPALKHLHLCRVPANAFTDTTLLALPELRSLTLSHVAGISSRGLSAFATRPNSQCLRNLRLRHTPLTSLPALARLLSHLPRLASLALVQDFAPLMPAADEDTAFALWMMPYLASRTLTRLHWDVAAGSGAVSDADDILARSIEAGGFPALRTIRAPSDPSGIFQQLCRPLEVVATSADRIWANGGRCGSSHGRRSASISSASAPSPSSSKLPKSATAPSLPTSGDPFSAAPHEPHATDLRASRIAAQTRLDDARPRHRFRVQVHSQEGLLVDDFGLAGYVGTVGSPIRYCLSPDLGATDARGGLVDVPDLTSAGGELAGLLADDADYEGGGVAGCMGSWNWREGVVADRKEKETWWHTERGRWIRPRLDGE